MVELDDVVVFHDVVFAFEANEAFFFEGGFRFVDEDVVAGVDFGADEAALDVGVDLAGGFLGGGSDFDAPRARFLRTDGELGHLL